MKAGKLRTLLTIQQRTDTADGQGGVVTVWSEFCKVYGRQYVSRAEVGTLTEQRESRLICKWEIRFMEGVLPEMRLVDSLRIFEINAVYDPSQKRERLELLCTELQNKGT